MNTSTNNRIIVLDTETTGMNREGPHYEGHRVIEIGAVEIINRRLTGNHYHVYLKPDRRVDPEAIAVHGITDEFLADKPTFDQVYKDFIAYIDGAEFIAHNAPFDVGFLDYEFSKLHVPERITDFCTVTDTLAMAKKIFPGKRNNLDILCDRYGIDNSHRTLHGALLDAEILADVYLLMTGGQTSLNFNVGKMIDADGLSQVRKLSMHRKPLKVIKASPDELKAHEERLDLVEKKKGDTCIWRL